MSIRKEHKMRLFKHNITGELYKECQEEQDWFITLYGKCQSGEYDHFHIPEELLDKCFEEVTDCDKYKVN